MIHNKQQSDNLPSCARVNVRSKNVDIFCLLFGEGVEKELLVLLLSGEGEDRARLALTFFGAMHAMLKGFTMFVVEQHEHR